MNLYPENYDVTIGVAFTDLNGSAVTPTAVRAKLYDGDDALILDFGSLPFDVGEGSKDIVVPAAFNVLGAGELRAARILRTVLETDAGEIRRASSYIVEGEIRLALMINSFVTYEAAELIAFDIPNLAGWRGADQEDRCAALISAYHRLTRIPMRFVIDPVEHEKRSRNSGYGASGYYNDQGRRVYHWSRDIAGYFGRQEMVIPIEAWANIDEDEFLSFTKQFRDAVRRAQVAQANDLLENDATARRHRQGIISETVGESSIMLRGNRIDLGLAAEALKYLTGHIAYNFEISRA